jgi:hypothetical protein
MIFWQCQTGLRRMQCRQRVARAALVKDARVGVDSPGDRSPREQRHWSSEQIGEAVGSTEGWSLARLGERMGVDQTTVLTRLRGQGVRMRVRRGGSDPQPEPSGLLPRPGPHRLVRITARER